MSVTTRQRWTAGGDELKNAEEKTRTLRETLQGSTDSDIRFWFPESQESPLPCYSATQLAVFR